MDVSDLIIGAVTPTVRSDKRVTIAAVNDDDSSTYSDSEDENGSELEAEMDRIMTDHPEIDWRWHVASGTWKSWK
jgi:hypothetical protein